MILLCDVFVCGRIYALEKICHMCELKTLVRMRTQPLQNCLAENLYKIDLCMAEIFLGFPSETVTRL